MVGIIVLFLLLNIVLFFSVLIWAWQTSETPKLSLNEICDSIVMDEAGHWIETVSSGPLVSLPEKGELAEINRQLNRAGAFIAKKDRARADWISGISHDVRTPLSVILGFAGQLEDNQTLPAPAREQAACIRKQGEKLRNLISDLNLVSRLEYAMQPLRLEKIYLVELARQVVCEFLDSGLEEQYRITFSSDQESETAFIMGDEALLKRALYNLIQNSMIHNSSGCDISVYSDLFLNPLRLPVSFTCCGAWAALLDPRSCTFSPFVLFYLLYDTVPVMESRYRRWS